MFEKVKEESDQNTNIQTYCPLTGSRIWEYAVKQFSISGLLVTWWHCPACGGWHLLTTTAGQEQNIPRTEPNPSPLLL